METIGPYRLTEMLSLRPAGRVWRAVDQQGTLVTLAVLETTDTERTHQFRTAASGPLQGQLAASDLHGPRPWAALVEDGGPGALQIFTRMSGGPAAGAPAAGMVMPPTDDMPTVMAPDAAWGPPGTVPEQPSAGYDPTPPQATTPADAPPGYGPHLFDSAPYGQQQAPGYEQQPPEQQGYEQPGYEQPAYEQAPPGYDPYAPQPGQTAAPQSPPAGYDPAAYGYNPAPNSAPPGYGPAPNSAPPPGYGPAPHSAPPGYPAPQSPPGYGVAPQSPQPGYDPAAYGPAAYGTAPQSSPPGYGAPHSAPPGYGAPHSAPPGYGAPHSAPPGYGYGAPQSAPPSYGPGPVSHGGWTPPYPPLTGGSEPPKRRGLLVAGVIGLVVLLVGAGVLTTWALTKDEPDPKPTAKTSGEPSAEPSASAPAAHPQAGKEPAVPGSWPAAWPRFAPTDKTTTMNKPAGLGFSFKVPTGWTCAKVDQSGTYAKWACKSPDAAAGGDVSVRECPEPCDSARKIQMRRAENAWSLQWTRVEGNTAYATSDTIPGADGKPGYGLIAIRYWHSKSGGPLDRQVVFRMTAPPAQKGSLQKILNEVRAGTP